MKTANKENFCRKYIITLSCCCEGNNYIEMPLLML